MHPKEFLDSLSPKQIKALRKSNKAFFDNSEKTKQKKQTKSDCYECIINDWNEKKELGWEETKIEKYIEKHYLECFVDTFYSNLLEYKKNGACQ